MARIDYDVGLPPNSSKLRSIRGILALWIVATEEAEFLGSRDQTDVDLCRYGHLTDASLVRYFDRLMAEHPIFSDCSADGAALEAELISIITSAIDSVPTLDNTCQTQWRSWIKTPWGLNVYRQFLKRMRLGTPSQHAVENLKALQENPVQIATAQAILEDYLVRVPFRSIDALTISFGASYSFGPGALSDSNPPTFVGDDSLVTRNWNNIFKASIAKSGRRKSEKQKFLEVFAEGQEQTTALAHLLLLDMNQTNATGVFVAKDYRSDRFITPHPGRAVLLQSQVAKAFVAALESFRLPRTTDYKTITGCYSDDQQIFYLTGELAQNANRIRCNPLYDTLDLSAASDSVTLAHIEQVLDEEWLTQILKYRVDQIKISKDEILQLSKTAFPMGAKLCFPVETCVFWSYAYAIARAAGAPSWVSRDIRVFGDDIVVPHPWGPVVQQGLEALGFVVNSSKSYYDGEYRETCGIETYAGSDVTPVRLPRGATEWWLYESDLATQLDFGRTLDEAGLFQTLSCFIELRNSISQEYFARQKANSPKGWGRIVKSSGMPSIGYPIAVTHDRRYAQHRDLREEVDILPLDDHGWEIMLDNTILYCPQVPESRPTWRYRTIEDRFHGLSYQKALDFLADRCGADEEYQRLVIDYLLSQVKGSRWCGFLTARSTLQPDSHRGYAPKIRLLYDSQGRSFRPPTNYPGLVGRVLRR